MSDLFIASEDRKRHIYLSGKTQHGKSTTMKALAYQDMRAGQGLCFIDAKGSETDEILDWVPAHRRDDTIYLDLEAPIPIDFMACQSHDELMSLVSDIVQIFDRFEDGLGVRMDALLRFTVVSLTRCGNPAFLDIYRFLTDEDFRKKVINHPAVASDPFLNNFWTGKAAEKIINSESGIGIAFSRMAKFVLSPSLRVILGSHSATFDFAAAIQDRNIVLVKLKPNSDESMLFGSLVVSKIQQAIFRRKKPTPPFALYIDEFQNFRSSGFEDSLSMAGGLGLYLTLANQYFSQLQPSVQNAIINNISTYFLFRMTEENASRLRGELREPVQPEPPDNWEKIRDLKESIQWLKEREDIIENYPGSSWTGEEKDQEGAQTQRLRFQRQEELEALQRPVHIPKIPTFRSQLAFLAPGEAIFRAADGTTMKIKTPAPPPPITSVGKTSHRDYIKRNTLEKYGRISQKRPGENPPCDTESSMLLLEKDVESTASTDKTDQIFPSGPPNVPDFPPDRH